MKHIRWYDKNPNLKELFRFLELLDSNHQAQIAQDILQMLMADFSINLDEKLNDIIKKYADKNKRWYDKNQDLATSFAIIKDFPPKLQQDVINKIVKTILQIYVQEIE